MPWWRKEKKPRNPNADDYSWSDIAAMIIAAFWVFLPYVIGLVVFVLIIGELLRFWAR